MNYITNLDGRVNVALDPGRTFITDKGYSGITQQAGGAILTKASGDWFLFPAPADYIINGSLNKAMSVAALAVALDVVFGAAPVVSPTPGPGSDFTTDEMATLKQIISGYKS